MIILGLTGSIGMGKTVAAGDFRRLGVPVHDSDAAVHRLLAKGGAAVEQVGEAFPDVVVDGAVDRAALGKVVFGDTPALRKLESILHPMVRTEKDRFLKRMARRRVPLVVLDIPLLFETNGQVACDAVAVVSAPLRVQRQRVLARPGMTVERFESVLNYQMSDKMKRQKADFVIQTGLGRRHSLRQITAIVRMVSTWEGRKWPPFAARS